MTTSFKKGTLVTPEYNALKHLEALSKQPYTPAEQISEFVDNSNSARIKGQPLEIMVDIRQDPTTKEFILSIKDNGSGIAPEMFGKVIGQGNSVGGGTGNEHGMGLKQAAISGDCYLKHFESRTQKSTESSMATFKSMSDIIKPFKVDSGDLKERGTYIEIGLPKGHPLTTEKGYYTALSQLQQIYQRVLGTHMQLETSNTYLGIKPQILKPDAASSHLNNPIYDNDTWIVKNKVLKSPMGPGKEWEAVLRVGFLPDNGTKYVQVPAGARKPVPTDISRFQRSEDAQGFYIFKGERLLHKTSAWALRDGNSLLQEKSTREIAHHNYNGLVVEIELVKGFDSIPTKNGLAPSPALTALELALKIELKRIHPDRQKAPVINKDAGHGKTTPLSTLAKRWNGVGQSPTVKIHPSTDIPWSSVSTHDMFKDESSWTQLKSFGDWHVWNHKESSTSVLTHKKGFDVAINYPDVPSKTALLHHINSLIPSTNLVIIHNDNVALQNTDYPSSGVCTSISLDKAPKMLRSFVVNKNPALTAGLSHFAAILPSLTNQLKTLNPTEQQTAKQLISTTFQSLNM